VVLTSLSKLESSAFITINNSSYTLNEGLAQSSAPSSLNLASTYPLTSNLSLSETLVGTTLTDLSTFKTFSNKIFAVEWPSNPEPIDIEGPCTSGASSFPYTLAPSLPSWLSYTPNSSTSTHTFTI